MVSHLFMRLRILYNGPTHSLSFTRIQFFFCFFVSHFEMVGDCCRSCCCLPITMQLGIFYFMYNMCMYENEKVMRFNDNLLHGSVMLGDENWRQDNSNKFKFIVCDDTCKCSRFMYSFEWISFFFLLFFWYVLF